MDFLKTLLAYVALTVAFSVQEGPLPQDVPTPTPRSGCPCPPPSSPKSVLSWLIPPADEFFLPPL